MNSNEDKRKIKYKLRVKRRLPLKSRMKINIRWYTQKIGDFFRLSKKRKRVIAKVVSEGKDNKKKVRPPRKKRVWRFVLPIILTVIVIVASFLMISIFRQKRAFIVESENSETIVATPKKIILHYGQKKYEILISHGTLKDVIEKADLVVLDEYEVIPDIYTSITRIDEAWVIIYEEKITTQTLETNFKIVEITDEEKKADEREVVNKGQPGKSKITFKRIYKNGILYSQVKIKEEIISPPKDEVVSVGIINEE